jgi:hypothetical protein
VLVGVDAQLIQDLLEDGFVVSNQGRQFVVFGEQGVICFP